MSTNTTIIKCDLGFSARTESYLLAFFVIGIVTVILSFSRLCSLYIEHVRSRRRNGANFDLEQVSNADLDLLESRLLKERARRSARVGEKSTEDESSSLEQGAPALRSEELPSTTLHDHVCLLRSIGSWVT